MNIDVGARLKTIRKMHGLSQRELAKRAGVTNGTISLIEQNRVSPSVSSLRKVLSGLPMSLGEFFTTDFSVAPKVFFEQDELTELGDGEVKLRLVAGQRRERAMSVMHEIYAPGADTGEAYYFDSTLPHRFRNPGDEECVIISANTPPSF
jgi:transcriptional regulator with XRE-family HTH domain